MLVLQTREPVKIVSLSPELFPERDGNRLISKPMKGTASRQPSWDADEAARIALHNSEKDRAENTMIVDLMRNDLGRICETGSVRTRDEYFVERFPTVHQMTTTVVGDLREDVSLFEIFKASFPAGSITGAPKVRASQIIQDIEPTPRGIYCGSIGLFYPGGDFVCNVAIRTLEINGSIATLGIGSGIVADSNPDREWEEVLLKSKFLERRPQIFGLYEAFRYIPEVGFKDIESHLRRLEHSCNLFWQTVSA
ncbi:MAG: anthranilate synthase component I family protein [bacterium]|nr:anthranilate synthase component I family protein [bacterium]